MARPTQRTGKPRVKIASPPRTAAVLTIVEGDKITMAEARKAINIGELGIASIRPRIAATGGIILEIAGEENGVKADKLTEKLAAILANKSVKITRPIKCADIRVTGLDDSITAGEVAEALAEAGGCKPEEIKVETASRVGGCG